MVNHTTHGCILIGKDGTTLNNKKIVEELGEKETPQEFFKALKNIPDIKVYLKGSDKNSKYAIAYVGKKGLVGVRKLEKGGSRVRVVTYDVLNGKESKDYSKLEALNNGWAKRELRLHASISVEEISNIGMEMLFYEAFDFVDEEVK